MQVRVRLARVGLVRACSDDISARTGVLGELFIAEDVERSHADLAGEGVATEGRAVLAGLDR